MNKIRQRIRTSLMKKIDAVDFAGMSKEEFGVWVNALPFAEFAELTSLHIEMLARERNPEPGAVTEPAKAEPDDDAWIPVAGDMPVPADERIYILYRDGEIGGPNRADAFLWNEPEGPTQILAYAPAGSPESSRNGEAT